MKRNLAKSGAIITFYSYKGGTGRSMAVANVAHLLARRAASSAQRVLVMDWDLEAPGLHRFFAERLEQSQEPPRPGLIDYFYALYHLLKTQRNLYKKLIHDPDGWQTLDKALPLADYISEVGQGLDFIKAGQIDDPQYPQQVSSFDWVDFYEDYGGIIRVFREMLAAKYAYCLIDSRTGVTDISGVCTTLMPEKLVAVFTPNRQSLYGLHNVVKQAVAYRRASDDFRPLAVFPLPSRIEEAEQRLKERWRTAYQQEFQDLFRQVYGVKECSLTTYFNEVLLPHVGYYAYGEHIAVLEERGDARSLSRAYQTFCDRLVEFEFAWEETATDQIGQTIAAIEQDLTVARQAGDRRHEANVLGNLGDAYLDLGEARRAVSFYEQARLIFEEIADRRGAGYALANLSNAYLALNETQRAIDYQQQYLEIAREIGDRRDEGNALGILGNSYLDLGEIYQAIECYEQALQVFQEIGDHDKEAGALSGLGLAYLALRQTRQAIDYYNQQLAVARRSDYRRNEAEALGNLGSVYADLGETGRALELYEQLLSLARQISDPYHEARALFKIGEVRYKLGQHSQAVKDVEAALKIYEQLEDVEAVRLAYERLDNWR
ncbi:MAG: tetratricopeptide repeat protein [Chloroflexota bacterium]